MDIPKIILVALTKNDGTLQGPNNEKLNTVKGTGEGKIGLTQRINPAKARGSSPSREAQAPINGTQLRKLKPSQGNPVPGSSNPVKGTHRREAQAQSNGSPNPVKEPS